MTDDRSLERAARSWLDEGPTRAPDRPVEAALFQIQTTNQERDLRIPGIERKGNPMLLRFSVAAAAIAIAVSGALMIWRPPVGPPATQAPATLDELNGPWRSEPLAIPGDVLAATEAACRGDTTSAGATFPPGLDLVIADAHGAVSDGGLIWMRGYLGFQGPTGERAFCFVNRFDLVAPDVSFSGRGCCGVDPAPSALTLYGGPLLPTYPVVEGRKGFGIAAVRIELENGVTAMATVRGDWFAVYTPLPDGSMAFRLLGLDASGAVVATFEEAFE